VPTHTRNRTAAPITTPSSAGQYSTMKLENPSSTLVIKGRSALKFANILAKAGITNMLTITSATAMTTTTNIG
jgi:hypothetical protein